MSLAPQLTAAFTRVGQEIKKRGIPVGGAAGQALIKSSTTDFATQWAGDAGWTSISLTNSYTATTDASIAVPAYRKDALGYVHLKGFVNTPSSAVAYQTFANLPAGYRPAKGELFVVNKAETYGSFQVNGNGDLVWRSGTPSSWLSLSGITYLAEA